MVKTIVIWILIAAAIIFFIVWALTGGIGRALKTGKSMLSPGEFFSGNASGTSFTLPWRSELASSTIDTADESFSSPLTGDGGQTPTDGTQDGYDQLSLESKRVKMFGNPSPHVGKIAFSSNAATETDPSQEYLYIHNASSESISLSGWSLQSVYSPGRIPIPQAAPILVTGSVNALEPVILRSGGSAFLVSAPSPVGASFRENKCTGYLAQFQEFTPPLNQNCPEPASLLPVSESALRTFGDTCIDYVRGIAVCTFPTSSEVPASITPACRAFVLNNFSYNGCVATHSAESDFGSDIWRVYLGSRADLWRDTHDVIRLLDETGRTVDVLTY